MSKILFLFLLSTVSLGFTEVQAQTWVNGGNTLAADGTIGTNSNHAFIFKTNNSEKARITNSGVWAIGTAPTSSKFTINSATGVSPFRVQINGVTKFIITNGGATVGSNSAGPIDGLYVVGNTGIGTNIPNYKLHVVGTIHGASTTSSGVYGYSSAANSEGVKGQSANIGVYGYAGTYGLYGVSANGGYGVYGKASGGNPSQGTGVYGRGIGFGVQGNVTAVSAYAVGAISSQSYGLYAYTGNASSYAGFFVGRVYSSGGFSSSDRKLKEDIEDVSSAMNIINQLHPKTYRFRQDGNYKFMNLPQGKHYGLIAQDVEQILPNLVAETEFNTARISQDEDDVDSAANLSQALAQQRKGEIINFKALNYTELIPIVVKAMQELDVENKKLSEENKQVKEDVAELRQMILDLKNERNTNNGTKAYLQGSTPNPASGTALIRYYVPQDIHSAHIVFTDMKGAILKSITLNKKGTGQLTTNTAAWSAGTYTYTLYVNGLQTDSNKLVIAR